MSTHSHSHYNCHALFVFCCLAGANLYVDASFCLMNNQQQATKIVCNIRSTTFFSVRSPVETPLQEESEDHHDEGQREGEGEVAELGAARPLYVTPGGVGRQPHPLVPEQPRERGHGEGGH